MFGRSYRASDELNDKTWLEYAQIKLKFCFWPQRCYITDKFIWLAYAYRATRMYTGPGEPVYEDRWYDKSEFLILRLKGML